MSPRRSSRARSSQQPTAPSQAHSSSSSTPTLKDIRTDQVKALDESDSPVVSQPVQSEPVDSTTSVEAAQPRRSRRTFEAEKDTSVKATAASEEDDNIAGEEEVTRCICGYVDYPGPSASIRDHISPAYDLGNFFVQCDKCHVWQHGGCLGLTDEETLPDEYYCEKCRPDLHRVIKASHLPKSSRYLPVLDPTARPVMLKKDSKLQMLQNAKRRATMNSRGAYDEDELLQRAIEESKSTTAPSETLGKRSRTDTDTAQRPASKRQRTTSNPSSPSLKSESPDPTSIEPQTGRNGSKLRGAAAKNSREKEFRELQKKEAAAVKAEAANKRNARSERRRVDPSPPPTPTFSPSKSQTKAKNEVTSSTKPIAKKPGGKLAPGRGKRLGRNQYTRDREVDGSDTPMRDTSHDRNLNGHNSPHNEPRSSKAKTHPARTSLNEMKKRVAAILEFVGHMQNNPSSNKDSGTTSENGGSSRSSNSKGGISPNKTGLPPSNLAQAISAGLNDLRDRNGKVDLLGAEEFARMASGDMMATLTRELMQWQTAFGIYSK